MDRRLGADRREQLTRLAERATVPAAVVGTLAVLTVAFYYPVGTVFDAAAGVPRVTLGAVAGFLADPVGSLAGYVRGQPVLSVLADPFYTGALATVFSDPAAVPGGVATWLLTSDPGLGLVWTGGLPPVAVVYDATFLPAFGLFGFTAYQAVLSTVASVVVGLPGAYLLARFDFPGRRTVRSLTIVPFVMPSILVAIGFLAMFGSTGTFNAVLGALRGLPGGDAALRAVGLPGPVELAFTLELVVLAHAFYNAPMVTRLVTAAWEGVDARRVETARSLGAGPLRASWDTVVPQLTPALLTASLLTFLFTFMSFAVVLTLGGLQLATVEVWLYARVQQLDLTEAASLAAVETVLSLALTYLYLRYEARQVSGGRVANPLPRRRLVAGWRSLRDPVRVGLLLYVLPVAAFFVGPVASLAVESVTGPDGRFTTRYWAFLADQQAATVAGTVQPLTAISNSLLFAVGTLVVAVPMGVAVALVGNSDFRGRKVSEAVLMAPLAVSGIVVGLGLLQGLVFGATVFGHRVTLTGPVAVVLAHAVAAYPFVTRNVGPQLAAVDRRLTESARVLGASRVRALLDVELPLVATGLLAGAAFAVAISVGEFDSTVVLAEGSQAVTMPVAVERYQGNRSLGPDLGPAAAMGCILLFVTAASFVAIDRLGGRWEP